MPNLPTADELLDRKKLAARWGVHTETIKRRERDGKLRAVLIGPRLKRYRLSDVLDIEAEGAV